MPRRTKVVASADELDDTGMIDRDEDLYNDNDDVSTSTMHESDESLAEYIKEENKINSQKSNLMNGKMRKLRDSMEKVVTNMKDKGRGLSCKNADNVIAEPHEVVYGPRDSVKSCSLM